MTNQASNPSNWQDAHSNTPPSWWTGTAYVVDDSGRLGVGTVMTMLNGPADGDTFSVDFQNFASPSPAGTSSSLILCNSNDETLYTWNLIGASGPTSSVYTFDGTEGQCYLQAFTEESGSPNTTYQADFSLTPINLPVYAPDLSISCPNMGEQIITPQIIQSGVQIQGYTLAIVTHPTNGTITVSDDGLSMTYVPTLGTTMVPDSFTYTATAGGQTSSVATVSVFIFTQYNCMCNGDLGEFPSETLDSLQRRLLVRMGMASMPIPPPGMAEFANDFLKEGQRVLYHKYRVFRSPRWFTWLLTQNQRFYDWTENVEVTSMAIDAPDPTISTATTGGSIGASVLTTYAVTSYNGNGESLPSTQIAITTGTGSTNANTLNWDPVDGASGYNIYCLAPNGPYGETELFFLGTSNIGNTYTDTVGVSGATKQPAPTLNYTSLCPKKMNPRRVMWVGISRGDNVWQPLFEGIDPTDYSPKIQAIPCRYSIRQCIEIWPAPSDNTWQLRVLADMNPLPFEQPTDVTSIDPQAIFLYALAMMKAHYGKPDASSVGAILTQYIGDLVADTRSTHRTWPGKGVVMNAIPPKMVQQ
jgi:hypothetical protein